MSHTFRIYNNPRIKKAQRYNIDDTNYLYPSLKLRSYRMVGLPLTHKSWICMGHCKMCCDPKLEQRKLRKQRKEQLRFRLKEEL